MCQYAIVETEDGYAPNDQDYDTVPTLADAREALCDQVEYLVREEGYLLLVQTVGMAVLSEPFHTTRLLVEIVAVAA